MIITKRVCMHIHIYMIIHVDFFREVSVLYYFLYQYYIIFFFFPYVCELEEHDIRGIIDVYIYIHTYR